jgi:hypothetical protein
MTSNKSNRAADRIRMEAICRYCSDEIEIDSDATVSGYWVAAWVWAPTASGWAGADEEDAG